MHIATLTTNFQITIPKAFRGQLELKAGQRFVFFAKGDSIVMTPERDISGLRGRFKGANTDSARGRR